MYDLKLKSSIRVLLPLLAALTMRSVALGQACEDLFIARAPVTLVHTTWMGTLEADYQSMLVKLGAIGTPIPEYGIGKMMYQHWKLNPYLESPLFTMGFKIVEPTAANPNEVARFTFPATYVDLIQRIQDAQGPTPYFKLAVFRNGKVVKLDETQTTEVADLGLGNQLAFNEFAKVIADGYVPLWPARETLGFVHDSAHVGEYLEFPKVFPQLQTYFGRYISEGWSRIPYYEQRAQSFNEMSFILKTEKYEVLENFIVSKGIRLGSLSLHAAQIRKALRANLPETLDKIQTLTDAFNDLFHRHGGGARDFFNVEMNLLPLSAIRTYVEAMKADPSRGSYDAAVEKGGSIAAIESLEGIKRQIQYVATLLKNESTPELQAYLAYRVAQLEIAMLQQRKLELSQVDIIRDSMEPMGIDTKTRRYFKSFQPPGSHTHINFVGR